MEQLDTKNNELEELMEEASLGLLEATKDFYKLFLKSEVYYINRFQEQPLSCSPTYPNEFFDILAVQDSSRVIIPIFTKLSFIEDWSGTGFRYKTSTINKLLTRVPEEWWIVLNPGQNTHKEFSPWEIGLLKGDEASIPELIEEIFEGMEQAPFTIHPVSEDSYQELKEELVNFANNKKSILNIYLAEEKNSEEKNSEEATDEKEAQLLIGIETEALETKQQEQLREETINATARLFIGIKSPKIYISDEKCPSSMIGMFLNMEPIYQNEKKTKKNSIFANIFAKK